MQLLQLFLLAEVQLAIPNSSPLMRDNISPSRAKPCFRPDRHSGVRYPRAVRLYV